MSLPVSVLTAPAPGWYPDPAGVAEYRWWDGAMWTEGTHGRTQPLTPVATIASTAPAADASPRPRGTAPAKTRWSSLLVAFPFVYPVALGMIVALAYAGGAASSTATLVVIGGVSAGGLLVPAWVFAERDRRELAERGYQPAPSIAWMLLLPPLTYLLARRRVVGPSH